MKELGGKVAVVTGGGSGIGRALCLALGREGATVAVCDLRAPSAEQTVEAVTAAGGTATAHEVDVSSEEAVAGLVEEVLARHGVVDVVVNNAGIGVAPVPMAETSLEGFRTVLDVNLWGVIHGSRLFLPHLLTRPTANLVNVCSFAGLMGMTGMPAYNVSKFGVRGLTESLQMEFHKSPLRVVLVCPGGTRTPLMANSPGIDESKRATLSKNLLESKQAVTPEKVADAIVAGIKKGSARVLVGTDTRMIDKLVRLLPSSYPKLMAPQLAKMYKQTLGS